VEHVWNGLLTCDYEHSRPDGTLLEWDLYTRSLINWPWTLMDEPAPYGRLRRPGIVDIPENEHTRLVAQWHTCLADPEQVRLLMARADRHKRQTTRALNAADDALGASDAAGATAALAEATSVFLAVNSTHIVNWLLPEEQWEDQLAQMFGDRGSARSCLSALMTPSAPGHMLNAHIQLLWAASNLSEITAPQATASALASAIGPVYGPTSPAESATAMENPAHVAKVLNSTLDSIDPAAELDTIARDRTDAIELRAAWRTAAVLAAAGDDDALRALHAIVPTCQWAADSEERRKELRHRYLATVRRWCSSSGVDTGQITAYDLLAHGRNR
jgi:hypothetical protein